MAQIRESEPNKFNLEEVEKKAHDKLEKVWMKLIETILHTESETGQLASIPLHDAVAGSLLWSDLPIS